MERLTMYQQTEDGASVAVLKDGITDKEAYQRLARYEDKQLDPEEILDPVELARVYSALQKLKVYEEAEREGRLFVSPCRVGDTIYLIDWSEGYQRVAPFKYEVRSIQPTRDFKDAILYIDGPYGNDQGFLFSEVGKKFFLTYEEAEAACK